MEKMKFKVVHVERVVLKKERAALCNIVDLEEWRWIPLSVMRHADAERIYEGLNDTNIEVHDWFAEKEGLA